MRPNSATGGLCRAGHGSRRPVVSGRRSDDHRALAEAVDDGVLDLWLTKTRWFSLLPTLASIAMVRRADSGTNPPWRRSCRPTRDPRLDHCWIGTSTRSARRLSTLARQRMFAAGRLDPTRRHPWVAPSRRSSSASNPSTPGAQVTKSFIDAPAHSLWTRRSRNHVGWRARCGLRSSSQRRGYQRAQNADDSSRSRAHRQA